MIVSHQQHDDAVLYIKNQLIERTSNFKYLTLNDKFDNDEEVKIRTAMAKIIKFYKCDRKCL